MPTITAQAQARPPKKNPEEQAADDASPYAAIDALLLRRSRCRPGEILKVAEAEGINVSAKTLRERRRALGLICDKERTTDAEIRTRIADATRGRREPEVEARYRAPTQQTPREAAAEALRRHRKVKARRHEAPQAILDEGQIVRAAKKLAAEGRQVEAKAVAKLAGIPEQETRRTMWLLKQAGRWDWPDPARGMGFRQARKEAV